MSTRKDVLLSSNQEMVLIYMAENTKSKKDTLRPSQISRGIKGDHYSAGWAMPLLSKLIKKDYVVWRERGKYSITTEGRKLAKKLSK